MSGFLSRVFPLRCPSCDALCERECARCFAAMVPPVARSIPDGLVAMVASFAYEGPAKRIVLGAKATGAHGWLDVMASFLAAPLDQVDRDRVVVTWPTGSLEHRKRRGFDPAERLARSYARVHGLRSAPLLRRFGGAQEGSSFEQRFQLRFSSARPLGRCDTVFVVDDVVTTGASMQAAAAALHHAGFAEVAGLAFARAGFDGPALRAGFDGLAAQAGFDGLAAQAGFDGPVAQAGFDGPAAQAQ